MTEYEEKSLKVLKKISKTLEDINEKMYCIGTHTHTILLEVRDIKSINGDILSRVQSIDNK